MPFCPVHVSRDPQNDSHEHHFSFPHIGMRKGKSVLAIFVGFCLWQTLRIFIPALEVHPIFIYIYSLIEIRETSDKTRDYGRMRIIATFVAIAVGLPAMFLTDSLRPSVAVHWHIWLEIAVLIAGALLVLCVAEWAKCRIYCGLAAAIYLILVISHFESSMYLFSIMRAFQTIIGVFIAWLINVKLLPYPPEPGSLSYYLKQKSAKKKAKQDGSGEN